MDDETLHDIKVALREFRRKLHDNGISEDDFLNATAESAKKSILQIHHFLESHYMLNGTFRLAAFFSSVEKLDELLKVTAFRRLGYDSGDFFDWIWGPLSYLFKKHFEKDDRMEKLLSTYQKVAGVMEAILERVEDRRDLVKCLGYLYEDILEFQLKLLQLFHNPFVNQKSMFNALWRDHELGNDKYIMDRLSILKDHVYALHGSERNDRFIVRGISELEEKRSSFEQTFQASETERKEQQEADVLRWIGPLSDLKSAYEKHLAERGFLGTGDWILSEDKFGKWWAYDAANSPESSIFWLRGKKGSGKTILSSVVIEHCQRVEGTHTGYFYCRENDPGANTSLAVLKGLLIQMVKKHKGLLPFYWWKMKHESQNTVQTEDQIKPLIEQTFETASRQFIIIDGLNECGPKEQESLVKYFKDQCSNYDGKAVNSGLSQGHGKLRVFFSTNAGGDRASGHGLTLTPSHTYQDIDTWLSSQMKGIGDDFNLSEAQKKASVGAILARADGMWIYARLVIIYLQRGSKEEFLKEIKHNCLPSDLKEVYYRLLERQKKLLRDPPSQWETARIIFGWMVCAKRPLKWSEMQMLHSYDTERERIDMNNKSLRDRDGVFRYCGPLVEVSPGFERLRLIHQTAREFIIENTDINVVALKCQLCIICLRYISLPCFSPAMDETDREQRCRDGYFVFQDYAVWKWMRHFEEFLQHCAHILQDEQYLAEFTRALEVFMDRYRTDLEDEPVLRDQEHGPHPDASGIDWEGLRAFPFYNDLRTIWGHIMRHQGSSSQNLNKISLKSLGEAVEKNRKILEHLGPQALAVGGDTISTYYGENLFKCSKLECVFFYEGFSKESERKHHENRHDRPFTCDITGCTQGVGFSSNKDRERHLRQQHPEEAEGRGLFVRPNTTIRELKHSCGLCGKSFTRKINLTAHIWNHTGERPHDCPNYQTRCSGGK
ncbi:hypothetical protein B0I35DRAFT_483330 [Stachybotrys elegans]|uniref:C2H2-type domain-containing protein n=1 Tax=Stachybotrys elegans TaxID=80388 RepID=A0A8K0SFM8_9HYPO|nr:hypothetical protein B0I35DRAFT_483330 [Stachybotrys elegans]